MSGSKDLIEDPRGRARAVADLIHRSFAGPIGNVFAIGVFLLGTDLYHEHPVETGLYLGTLAFRLLARVVLTLAKRRTHAGPVQFPLWAIAVSAYTLSIPTGAYAAFVIRTYGYQDWNTVFIYGFALACAISGTTAIAPNLRIGIGFQVSLLLPIVVASFSMSGRDAYVGASATLLFTTYAIIQAIRQNADYWNSVATDAALRNRAEEVEAARQAATAASQAKSQFLANMSHEIRTPMNGVLGMLELVLRSDLTAEQREQLGCAHESAQSLLRLLNDILDHSKAEAGKLELERTEFAVRDLIDSAIAPFRAQAAAKALVLTAAIEDDVPRFLKGDPTRLRQVITNFVSNALKFTSVGFIRVSVSVNAAADEHTVLRFVVEDTGPGIPPEKQALIFDAFSQADESITRRFGGSGLGLTICRDLVKLMGGRIWVESEPGHGSRFGFAAPFVASSGESLIPEAVSCQPAAAGALKVLIAEDNLINQTLLARVLESGGHSYEIAANGEEALVQFSEARFDLILMDVQMPGMDGLEATRRIRAMECGLGSRMPIVGVTAGATAAELSACIDAGMDSCITKPIAIREVDELLARVWSRMVASQATPGHRGGCNGRLASADPGRVIRRG